MGYHPIYKEQLNFSKKLSLDFFSIEKFSKAQDKRTVLWYNDTVKHGCRLHPRCLNQQ